MRRKSFLGVCAILALVLASLPAASASSSAPASSADDDRVEVIRVTAVTVQETFLDLGDPGDSLGDQVVDTHDLFRAGEKVGSDGAQCTVVRLEPEVSITFQCVGTASLPRGQITFQGLVTFSAETEGEPVRLAITGGTGRFREAGGVLIVRFTSDTEAILTYRIVH